MTGGERVVVVGALSEEVAALAGRLRDRVEHHAGDLRFAEGSLAGRRLGVAATGDGPRRAARGLRDLIETFRPTQIWVIGVAGGLSPDLEVGDLVAARAVLDGVSREAWRSSLLPVARATPGTVVTADRILSFAEDKRQLWEALGSPASAVVDVESSACVRVAQAAGVAWRVLRAVSDPAAVDLPLDFESFRNGEGSLERSRIARHAAVRPSVVRRLLELRGVVERCGVRLAEAVAHQLEVER
jgi:adenosylhomocysteine nucleosidase